MAKGSHRRPEKGKKRNSKISEDIKDLQRIREREKASRKSKDLVRQMRGKKWSEEEEEEYEEELEDEIV